MEGDGAGRFPYESLHDWVSYADHVVVYTVVSEREIPPPADEIERGEGLVGRTVTLRVDERIWSANDAPRLPSEIQMRALGWVLQSGKKRELQMDDAPRVEMGESLLVPVVRMEDGDAGPEWAPLAIGAQLPLRDGRITSGRDGPATGAAEALAGKSTDQAREMFAGTDPDPLAAKYLELRPVERIRAVLADRGDQPEPAPSEKVSP